MRPVPGGHGPAGGGDPPAGRRQDDRVDPGRADPAGRRGARDARRIDLWAGCHGSERDPVGDHTDGRVRRTGRCRVSRAMPLDPPRTLVDVEIDGRAMRVPDGATILDACRADGVDTPTMCYADNLTPVNACRVCVVEVEGARALVPACSRTVEAGMKVRTDTDRVRHSRRLVMEFLGSSVDTSLGSQDWHRWQDEYGAEPERFGAAMPPMAAGER